ncbi:hypothetical protein J4418_01435 [Candidatus Woesearchaeota archaeon]|nr:hypothetical protein [Candidatus Woesearchaeota archaeon]
MLVLKSKKGVSPLIATILLIAFAVALGAVVMQIGSGLAGDDCSADLQISTQGFICFNDQNVQLNLKNSGNSELAGVSVWVHGSKDGIKTKNFGDTIAPNSLLNLAVEYDITTYGDIENVEIIPKFKKGSELVSCDGAKLNIQSIATC